MTDRDTKRVAHQIKQAAKTAGVGYRQGEVVDTSPLTIKLGKSDVPIPGVVALDSYTPQVGHIVHVLRLGSAVTLVLGTAS